MSLNPVTDQTFQKEVKESSIPVLVDFWAEWCGPCKMLTPVLEEIAKEFTGEFKIVSVNVDDQPTLATIFGIRGIPALVFFKDGKPVDQIVGMAPKGSIIKKMKNI